MLLTIPQKKPTRLSEELAELQKRFEGRPVYLRSIIVALKGRAYMLLLILLSLPFLTPIPLPGFSTPFGLIIALIAARLVLGKHPWLPRRFLRRELPAGFFDKLVRVSGKVVRFMEAFLRPRWIFLFKTPLLLQVHALIIFLSALVLLLPLPIPFSNAIPAWAILFVSAGMLERDGLAVSLGYVAFALGVAYFLLLGELAERIVDAWLRLVS